MTTILEVMEARKGISEIPGKDNNPVIVKWFSDVGRADVQDDETSYCSASIGSAAVESELPIPPPEQVLLARSWCLWGVTVAPDDVQPGDLTIWPRKGGAAWQGHVNVVKNVLRVDGKIYVECIGANQGVKGKPDSVTLAKARDIAEVVPNGIRRAVPATIKDLRPHSSEIKRGDNVQTGGGLVGFFGLVLAALKDMFDPVTTLPPVKNLPETLSLSQQIVEGSSAVLRLAKANWWLAAVLLGAVILIGVGHRLKAARLERHQAGLPLAKEVV